MFQEEYKYFNFPILLLEGFMEKDKEVLRNIRDYSIFVHCQSYQEEGSQVYPEYLIEEDLSNYNRKELTKMTCEFYELKKINSHLKSYKNGREIFNKMPKNTPMVGLKVDSWKKYFNKDKDDFEKICLLGFLAFKSIIQNKAYCKIDNKYWLSRMDGRAKSVKDISELSDPIRKYATIKYTQKIKNNLIDKWGLVYYSYYTRGFYFSFKLKLDDLVHQAEKRRISTKEKQRKIETQNTRLLALKKINNRKG